MQCISIGPYGERFTPEEWDFPNITRPFSLVYYALGGSAFYTVDGIERPLEKNHLYIFPANRVFSLREDKRDKFYLMFVHAFTSPEVDSVIDIDVTCDAFVSHTLELLRVYVKNWHEIYVRKLTDMLLSYIFETRGGDERSLSEKIKSYIDANFVTVFKQNDLSRQFNYSRSHISKVFKEKYNLTPKQYAKQIMLKEIEKLLFKGVSVAEIAERLDFSSPENLSRFFKGGYGYSPLEHKKRFGDFSV